MTRRKTNEEFKQQVGAVFGDQYTLLSPYVKATEKIKVKNNNCGHIYDIRPNNLLNGSHCPICSLNHSRKTAQQYTQEVYDLVGNEYTVVTPYINARIPITIKHNKCGNKYSIRPDRFLNGDRCPFCSRTARMNTSQFKKRVYDKYGDEYKVVGKYVNSGAKIAIKHKCGYQWNVNPNNFLRGKSHCPACRSKRLSKKSRLDIIDIKARVAKLFDNNLIITSNYYVNTNTMLDYHCNVCGYNGRKIAKNLLQGHGCPRCANIHRNDNRRYTITEVKKIIHQLYNGEYVYIGGKYNNATSKIKIKHIKCGTVFTTSLDAFKRSRVGCPKCSASMGEQEVQGYLRLHNISYKYGYIISDLVDKRSLHFDFWLPKYQTAIEYDGVQHYIATKFNQYGNDVAKKNFKIIQKHDRMKDQYCKSKNIRLIRIPYTKKVNDILNKQLLPIVKLSNNKAKIEFKETSSNDLLPLMLNYHYLHRRVATSYSYGLYVSGELMGMVTYTKPRLSLAQSISDKANRENTLELSRLYIMDSVSQQVPNITSKFVGWSLRQLKKRGNWYIISFADSGMHHTGAIYQATNFLYCGTTKPGEYAWNGLGKHGGAWERGKYYRYMIQSSQKYRYIKFIGSKSFKKHARKELKFEVQIYPKLNSVHYQIGDIEERLIRDRETGRIYKESELAKKLGMIS